MSQIELDVTKNIKTIETLKSRLLQDIASLYANMLKLPPDRGERDELLADVVLSAYLLSVRLGQDSEVLEELAIRKLRAEVLKENNPLQKEQKALLQHLNRVDK